MPATLLSPSIFPLVLALADFKRSISRVSSERRRSVAVVRTASGIVGGVELEVGVGRIRRSDLCARKSTLGGGYEGFRRALDAIAVSNAGSCLQVSEHERATAATHSDTTVAFLTTPATSTTNTTALASAMYFFASSCSRGCPGKSTSLICLVVPSGSSGCVTLIVDAEVCTEVCVCG